MVPLEGFRVKGRFYGVREEIQVFYVGSTVFHGVWGSE